MRSLTKAETIGQGKRMDSNAKTIMIQGTSSGVGKSTLAIGICRLFWRRGMRTAPFKAQNLSDNAHILPDGRRMARSQAIAAAACGIEPQPDMNPVLLRPYRGGCETVLNGEPAASFDRETCRRAARLAYERLCEQYEVIVAEGAGSPVELNLRKGDIVNMDFAMYANCPVILVTDIRRGGAFAALYGTMQLFSPQERALIKGIIVNDFYGDPDCFEDGKRMIEQLCGVPVLGILPHLKLHLEDEDDLPGENTVTREKLAQLIPNAMTPEAFQQQQFDLLADQLEEHLDVETLLAITKGEV